MNLFDTKLVGHLLVGGHIWSGSPRAVDTSGVAVRRRSRHAMDVAGLRHRPQLKRVVRKFLEHPNALDMIMDAFNQYARSRLKLEEPASRSGLTSFRLLASKERLGQLTPTSGA